MEESGVIDLTVKYYTIRAKPEREKHEPNHARASKFMENVPDFRGVNL
jgi:hypothetical protein